MDDAASRGRPGRARSPLDRIFVDGAWREGRARRRPDHNPYNGEVIAEIAQADAADLDAAYAAASRAQED